MKYIAHRGNNVIKAQNQIKEVLQTYYQTDVDGIEIDVRATKDYTFVLSHNSLLKKENLDFDKIESHMWKNLKKNKYWLNKRYQKIDTLDKLLASLDPTKIIMLDCKVDKNIEKYAHKLVRVLKKHKKLFLYICSFNYSFCTYMKQRYPYKVGLIIGYLMNEKKDVNSFDFLSLHYNTIKKSHYKKPFYIWTINQKKELDLFSSQKECLGVITDKSDFLKNKG